MASDVVVGRSADETFSAASDEDGAGDTPSPSSAPPSDEPDLVPPTTTPPTSTPLPPPPLPTATPPTAETPGECAAERSSAEQRMPPAVDAAAAPMPPFAPLFATPFVAPYLPQSMATGAPPFADAPPQDFGFRVNPFSGGYFLSPSQYQQMMQYYLCGMAQQQQLADGGDTAEALARFKLDAGSRQVPAFPFYQMMPGAVPAVPPHALGLSREHSPAAPPGVGDARSDSVTSADAAEHDGDSLTPPADGQQQGGPSQSVGSGDEAQSDVESSKDGQENDANMTSVLIKKQMNEIEREIKRRLQNENVRQMDAGEMASLLSERAAAQQAPGRTTAEAAIPWPMYPLSGVQFAQPRDDRTLDDVAREQRSTVAPPPVDARQSFYQAHFPQAPVPSACGAAPGGTFAPPQLWPSGLQQSLPAQYAAALYEQMQWQGGGGGPDVNRPTPPTKPPEPAAWTDGAVAAVVAGSNGASNGYDIAQGPSPGAARSPTADDDERVAADGEEPVWVMRESYLKRLKREEERQLAKERSEEQLRMADAQPHAEGGAAESDTDSETDRLLDAQSGAPTRLSPADAPADTPIQAKPKKKEVLIEGVLFRAHYLGSTQLVCEGRPTKTTRMMQAQEAVSRIKAPDGEAQPSTDVDLFISTEKIMVLNTDLQRLSDTDVRQDIMMDHPLRTVSYIADIGDVVVLMARRVSQSASPDDDEPIRRTPRVICHVFESDEAQFIAQSIGQAFQVAYIEFLRANGIDDPSYLREIDYQEVLSSQEIFGDELEMFARKETQKDVVVPKQKGEPLGLVIVESGWGSMLPTVVIANLMPGAPAARCNALNIGDQIIAVSGVSLVGLPLAACQTIIKDARNQTAVRLTLVHTPPVVEVRIKRPDTKYQLGFSVQNGVICSLLRGGIAERGGVRVGHRIIEINGQSVVAVAHEKIVNMLATAVGEIQMKTMPTSMFRLLTGQETPNYI